MKTPEFKLISHTNNPLETVFAAWAQSRPTQYPALFDWLKQNYGTSVLTAKDVTAAVFAKVISQEDILEIFKKITEISLPISEMIHFTWGFTNLPIEWREQAVRKRQWSFWLTSMREFTMEDFASDERYCLPPEGTVSADSVVRFKEMIESIEKYYVELQEKWGWAPEKARKVIPLSATHNGTMGSNYRTLLDTLASRTCWIAQVDIWGPVVLGAVSELSKIHPVFKHILSPPCFARWSNEFKGCKYNLINENRCSGKDMYAPCPLYCRQKTTNDYGISAIENVRHWETFMLRQDVGQKFIDDGLRLIEVWKQVWQRNPITGELL